MISDLLMSVLISVIKTVSVWSLSMSVAIQAGQLLNLVQAAKTVEKMNAFANFSAQTYFIIAVFGYVTIAIQEARVRHYSKH